MRGVLLRAFGKRRAVDAVGSRKRVGEPHHHRHDKLLIGRHHVGGAMKEQTVFPEALAVVRHPKHAGIESLLVGRLPKHVDRVGKDRIRFDHAVVVGVADIFDRAAREVRCRAFGAKDLALVGRTFEISGTVRAVHVQEKHRR